MNRTHVIRQARLTLLAATLSLVACQSLPTVQGFDLQRLANAGQKASVAQKEFTPQEEAEIGSAMASLLLGGAQLDPDRELQHYVNQVGRWLANQSTRPELAWHFGVLDDPNLNAYAAPGGYVFITRGLVDLLQNEAELAGVLAHEISHVVYKHHLNAVKASASREALGELAVFAQDAYQAHKDSSSSYLQGAGYHRLIGVTKDLYIKGLDRDDEFAADDAGTALAARAGYDPYALMVVLQRLEAHNPADSHLALMFKTHPKPAERLGRLDPVLAGRVVSGGELGAARFLGHRK